jgi:site-specific DNA-adenine methylase
MSKYPGMKFSCSDLNAQLIDCYNYIKEDVDELIKQLKNIVLLNPDYNTQAEYNRYRDAYNNQNKIR